MKRYFLRLYVKSVSCDIQINYLEAISINIIPNNLKLNKNRFSM